MKNTINLLSFNAKPLTFWEKLYVWALTIGRYLIIITDLIVILGFIYKFRLDAGIALTKANINQDMSVAKRNYTQQILIQKYQTKIHSQQILMKSQTKISNLLSHTLSLIPSNVSIDSISMSGNTAFQLNGQVGGTDNTFLAIIQNLANTYKQDSQYANVKLSNINADSQTRVTTFTITSDIVSNSQGQ